MKIIGSSSMNPFSRIDEYSSTVAMCLFIFSTNSCSVIFFFSNILYALFIDSALLNNSISSKDSSAERLQEESKAYSLSDLCPLVT